MMSSFLNNQKDYVSIKNCLESIGIKCQNDTKARFYVMRVLFQNFDWVAEAENQEKFEGMK